MMRVLSIPFAIALTLFATAGLASAQSVQESAAKAAAQFHIVHPRIVPREQLLDIKVRVKPEMLGKHPRTFWTREEARQYWEKHSGATKKEQEERAAKALQRIQGDKKKGKVTHGAAIFGAAHIYEAVRDPELAKAIIGWMMDACDRKFWGKEKGWRANYDLPAAYNFTGFAAAYDTLYDQLTPEQHQRIRDKITQQARVGFAHDRLDIPRKRKFTYDQNHHFLPVSSLGMAAFTFYEEIDEAPRWADMARRSMDRSMAFYAPDGYFFEGPLYWSWTANYVMQYVWALERMTGETLAPEGAGDFKYYLAHHSLPPAGGQRSSAFHFGDANQKHVKLRGTITHYHDRPIYMNFSWLAFWAPRLGDPQMLGVVEHWRPGVSTPWIPNGVRGTMQPDSIETMPTWHYFPDNEVLNWRESWNGTPLCVAFKCGPPEGHEFLDLYNAMEDARFNFGHAHPDAGSFQIDVAGELLATGPGYIKNKRARFENTLLVDGRGQRNDGQYHTWRARDDLEAVPYADYDPIRMEEVGMSSLGAYGRGQFAAAFYKDLEVTNARRHLFATASAAEGSQGHVLVYDEVDSPTPHTYTFMLHTVREAAEEGPRSWIAKGREAGLRVQALGTAKVQGEAAPTVLEPYHAPPTMPAKSDPKMDRRAEHIAISTTDKSKRGEMLTSILPVSLKALDTAPKVAALGIAGIQGIAIEHANGIKETKLIAPQRKWAVAGAKGDSIAAWWATDPQGACRRMTALRATAFNGSGIEIASDKPVDISLQCDADGNWAGELRVTEKTDLRLAIGGNEPAIAGAKRAGKGKWRVEPGRYGIGR